MCVWVWVLMVGVLRAGKLFVPMNMPQGTLLGSLPKKVWKLDWMSWRTCCAIVSQLLMD